MEHGENTMGQSFTRIKKIENAAGKRYGVECSIGRDPRKEIARKSSKNEENEGN